MATVGALPVNTYTPLEVSGSASARRSGVCMVKPAGPTAVTMLPWVSTVLPSSGEVCSRPWICQISASTGMSYRIAPIALSRASV